MPLTRRRRQILIATLVVVGIFVAWLQLAPRRDPRFAGTWKVKDSPPGVKAFWRFAADGTGRQWVELEGSVPPVHVEELPSRWHWRSEGDTIIAYQPGIRQHVPSSIVSWCGKLGIHIPGIEIHRLEASEIAPDRMVLRHSAMKVVSYELELFSK
jgi:hypothetical protein